MITNWQMQKRLEDLLLELDTSDVSKLKEQVEYAQAVAVEIKKIRIEQEQADFIRRSIEEAANGVE